jgi:methionyl-tRNA formyltransferase
MATTSQSGAKSYLVLGCKPWNRRVFEETAGKFEGQWCYVGAPEQLTVEAVRQFGPRYLFFLHWSWKVPKEIVEEFECVCFHMTDVPYGRGGSPLQNLILRGHRETRLSALRMVPEFDAGPVYLKCPLSLEGSAEEIYLRATRLSMSMIERIMREQPSPVPQSGEVVNFKRRTPQESEIGAPRALQELYDFIRMLDSEGYPRAFIEHHGFRFEFGGAMLREGRVDANVKITSLINHERTRE